MSVFGQTPKKPQKICLIVNNSVTHYLIVLKFGRLVCSETSALGNFENPLLVKSKMADNGSECKM